MIRSPHSDNTRLDVSRAFSGGESLGSLAVVISKYFSIDTSIYDTQSVPYHYRKPSFNVVGRAILLER